MTRTIKVQIASGLNHRVGTLLESGPEQLRAAVVKAIFNAPEKERWGAVSVTAGHAMFEGDGLEAECTVTIHEATTEDALCMWHMLRGEIDGVDCGRVYDRGLSWCAKSYENNHHRSEGRAGFWTEDDYAPVECA